MASLPPPPAAGRDDPRRAEPEHFVTLFDSGFLPQGLALHASMLRHLPSFCLWVLCVDDRAHELLTRLALPHCRPLRARMRSYYGAARFELIRALPPECL